MEKIKTIKFGEGLKSLEVAKKELLVGDPLPYKGSNAKIEHWNNEGKIWIELQKEEIYYSYFDKRTISLQKSRPDGRGHTWYWVIGWVLGLALFFIFF